MADEIVGAYQMLVPPQTSPLTWDRGSRRQAIVGSLLTDVFQGRLRAGQHLVTQELAARFGVSHTPIREALITMAGIGVIDLIPNRGAIVRRVSSKDIHEVCQVRRVLECEAVRNACRWLDPAELRSLAAELHRQLAEGEPFSACSVDEARDFDSRLHDTIAGACGNTFLAKELGRLKVLFRVLRDIAWQRAAARHDFSRLGEESRQHLRIVEALMVGDRREAVRAMSRHILGGGKYWSRALEDVTFEPASEESLSPANQGEHP